MSRLHPLAPKDRQRTNGIRELILVGVSCVLLFEVSAPQSAALPVVFDATVEGWDSSPPDSFSYRLTLPTATFDRTYQPLGDCFDPSQSPHWVDLEVNTVYTCRVDLTDGDGLCYYD